MSKPNKPYTNLWDYLEKTGVLEWGSDEDIKKAKKEYKKIYHRSYMQERRKTNQHITLLFDKDEIRKIKQAADRHSQKLPAFINAACLAYLENRYLVPNDQQVARLEQLLSLIYSQIQEIGGQAHQLGYWDIHHLVIVATDQLQRVEQEVSKHLRDAETLQDQIKEAVAQDPTWSTWLRSLLDHDHQN